MEFGKRFAQASALTATLAMATLVGTASARRAAEGGAGRRGSREPRHVAAPAPAVPTFVNGMAQPVFATGEANWVNHELWVESNFDSDNDGKPDRIHVDVSRPTETDTEGLKVPVIFEDSPYYAGGSASPNCAVDHELGATPAARIRAPYFNAEQHEPADQHRPTSPHGCRAASPSCTPSRPARGHSDGCTTSGAPNETLGAVAVIDWLNGRAKGYTTRAGTDRGRGHVDHGQGRR